jgi:hypothetical protein
MEVKFDIGGQTGQQVNVQAAYQLDDVISFGVSANGDGHLQGLVEYNDPSLFCVEVSGGLNESEWQFPYNIGVRHDTAGILARSGARVFHRQRVFSWLTGHFPSCLTVVLYL